MNKFFAVFFAAFVFLSCNTREPREQKKFIEGYWEIERVELPGDSVIDYNMNETIDYFEIVDSTGFRKKMRPQIDGSYKTTDDAEEITVRIEDDSLRIYYKTPFDEWKETLIRADDEEMSLLNREGIIYHYKKYTPLFSEDEE